MKIAVAGAGIYGSSIAIRLAAQSHSVHLFDPLGVLCAASAINQYRVHAGYHYPRSHETIAEILEARAEFLDAFAPAIVRNSRHYYAIPREHSRTPPTLYESLMAQHGLALRPCRPEWLDYSFIDSCYEVDEHIYDPAILRDLIAARINASDICFHQQLFLPEMRDAYDFTVWATYGLSQTRGLFERAKYQVAEKVLVQLPPSLHHVALVVVDGPFTAFDPYGASTQSLFGSALHTNHWSTTDASAAAPDLYAAHLNGPRFEPVSFSRFEAMRDAAALAVPAAAEAEYLGSRFVVRVVEDSPGEDRRVLYIREGEPRDGEPRELHIFSGKVVSAVKAARLVCERIAQIA